MTPTERVYRLADVKALIDGTGSWARSWDDVLHYLESPTRGGGTLPGRSIPQLAADIRRLEEENARFTTDYREAWQALTGDSALAPDTVATEPPPSRVLDILHRIQSREYREMAGLSDARHGHPK